MQFDRSSLSTAVASATAPAVAVKRVLFLINSLEGGGAERVFSTLVNAVQPHLQGAEIRVVLLDDKPRRYEIASGINVICLGSNGKFLDSALRLKRYLDNHRPDLVVSFLTRANYLAAALAGIYGYRSIISERSDTNSRLGGGVAGWAKKWLVSQLYPRANGIIAVSGGIKNSLVMDYRVPADKITVIHNPCDINKVNQLAEQPCANLPASVIEQGYILAVGRLVNIKRFDILIRAYAAGRFAQHLVILGEGPKLAELQALAAELGVADRVVFPGFLSNPYPVMAKASVFVLSSDQEGFPNSLVEAMAVGRPVISTNCNGAAEILDDLVMPQISGVFKAKYGLLVPTGDVDALASALQQLFSDAPLQAALAGGARERASHFSVANAIARYAAVINPQLAPADQGRG